MNKYETMTEEELLKAVNEFWYNVFIIPNPSEKVKMVAIVSNYKSYLSVYKNYNCDVDLFNHKRKKMKYKKELCFIELNKLAHVLEQTNQKFRIQINFKFTYEEI